MVKKQRLSLSTHANGKKENEQSNTRGTSTVVSVLNLPQDIIVEIISRLPKETIVCSRRVCKPWSNIILESRLLNTCTDKVFSGPGLLFANEDNTLDLFNFYTNHDTNRTLVSPARCAITFDIPKEGQIRVIDTCNGFICLSHSFPDDNDITLFIANPILGECIALPKPKKVNPPFTSAFAFAFSPCSQRYKVLCISGEVFLTNPAERSGEICTLGTDCTWKSIGYPPFPADKRFVTVEGAIHWLDSNSKCHTYIYSVDIDKEIGRRFSIPFPLLGASSGITLGVIFNHLCVVKSWRYAISSTIEIWMMSFYGNPYSWTSQYTFRLNYTICSPARVWKNDEMVVWRVPDRTLRSHSIADDAYTKLKVSSCKLALDAVTYNPCLYSLNDVMTGSQYNHMSSERLPFGP